MIDHCLAVEAVSPSFVALNVKQEGSMSNLACPSSCIFPLMFLRKETTSYIQYVLRSQIAHFFSPWMRRPSASVDKVCTDFPGFLTL